MVLQVFKQRQQKQSAYDTHIVFNVAGPVASFDPALTLSGGTPMPTWDFRAPNGATFRRTGAAFTENLTQTGTYRVILGPLALYPYVTATDMYTDGLTGTIPASIGNLVNLTILALYSNQLTGAIPAAIGNLVNLTYLYLYSNQLTDIDPVVLGPLVKMHDLRLQNNGFSQAVGAKVVSQIYAAWGTWTDVGPLINVAGTNAALDGVYAAPPGPGWTGAPGTWVPGTSKTKIYDLVNDVNVTGRIKQAWTFN